MPSPSDMIDSAAIADQLESVRERIERACARAGRSSDEITLIAVTKTFPVEAVLAAQECGLSDFGENRVQELVEKIEAVPSRIRGGDVTWHMIGHLQRNKARDVVDYADFFHALDSLRLAKELNKRAAREGRVVRCLAQINASREESKFGIAPEDAVQFLDALAPLDHLRIEGLMTIASFVDDPEDVRPEFRRLREMFERHEGTSNSQVEMTVLSMGMSNDFEVAIEEGATHVRIGSAIFGARDR